MVASGDFIVITLLNKCIKPNNLNYSHFFAKGYPLVIFLQILRLLLTLHIILKEYVFMPPFTSILALRLIFFPSVLQGKSLWIPLWNYSTKHFFLPAGQSKQFAHWIPSYMHLAILFELIFHFWTWWNSYHLVGKQRGFIVDLTLSVASKFWWEARSNVNPMLSVVLIQKKLRHKWGHRSKQDYLLIIIYISEEEGKLQFECYCKWLLGTVTLPCEAINRSKFEVQSSWR